MPKFRSDRGRTRSLIMIACTIAWLAFVCFAPAHKARAHQAKGEAAASAGSEGSDSSKAAPPAKKSMLRWAAEASGPIGFFLFLISIYFTALVIRLFMEMRLSEAVPQALIEKVETAIKEKKFQDAYDACRDNNSYLARMIRTGVANLPNGRPEAKEAMTAQAEEMIVGMESRITYLATIGTLGPMIGLVGTIWGMIQSFQEIATQVGGQARPDKLAAGISTALFITLEGVSLSVPAIFFYAVFRNRISKIAMEGGRTSERIIALFWAAAKQPASKPS